MFTKINQIFYNKFEPNTSKKITSLDMVYMTYQHMQTTSKSIYVKPIKVK